MIYAAITGWGKCLPPAILTNNDLATFLDTSDEWITTRTGMKERRISHVDVSELAYVAAARALAAAGKQPEDVELIVFGSTTFDEMCPNGASNVQRLLNATRAACMDLNTACTSGMYSLSSATAMIKSGVVKSAIIIGAEVISKAMQWSNRDVAVLFGDGAAALYLEASETAQGVITETLGCIGESREILSVQGWGLKYNDGRRRVGETTWAFAGQEIFKKAVNGMAQACEKTLEKAGLQPQNIDLVVPHQANLRIIETLSKKLKMPMEKVYVNIHRYGNMSAATALVALVEALEEGYVQPGNMLLMPAFGGGLTLSSHLVKWGNRTQPIARSSVFLPANDKTGLEIVNELREQWLSKNPFS